MPLSSAYGQRAMLINIECPLILDAHRRLLLSGDCVDEMQLGLNCAAVAQD
jgi:hypothetical protein